MSDRPWRDPIDGAARGVRMRPVLTFVVPVRHQDNAPDWAASCRRLAQTVASIAAQSNRNWRGVVVANHGAALPELPAGFAEERVSFPPNALHDLSSADRELVYDAVRLDKGRRILAGMLAARDTDYFMIVDDDDFVSSRLTDFVARHPAANGWKIQHGWVWGEGGALVMRHDDFSNYCGTSLIIRADLYRLPVTFDDASEDYLKSMLGSHVRIARVLAERGSPIAALPFRGAIYRVGHSGAHSKSEGLLKSRIFNRKLAAHPLAILRNALSFRVLSRRMKREFFG